jgi:hypothetical protein
MAGQGVARQQRSTVLPAPMGVWLPQYASDLGARPPKTAPSALARLAVGGWGVAFMTQLRGDTNARAKTTRGQTGFGLHPRSMPAS